MMRGDEIDREFRAIVFDFFYWFSRFEFALKERRYLKSHVVGRKAEPSWKEFWEAHEGAYKLTPAAKALIAAKPERQIVGEPDHDFEEPPIPEDASDLQALTIYVRTVRNNLFHGGKHGLSYWSDPPRTRLLLTTTITILDELARLGGFGGDYDLYY
ncbi:MULTISPECIES: hypothetical protein [unclassified Sphingopyxis]|uniref:hypothetical protein n=1 Tax=unclassified Sphingopyxis TaxID=2614943 RepID=UPI0007363246|nr:MULTISPECIES: hypothetical protein [unclassified Sphingopyxis]KTE21721.1 hypothetical protein ATE67_03405 [Sphingopyxis sp. H050]KTE32406.1 hypothetical protein ATE62_18130 [Sphingopyxis sp. HIX]